MGIYIKDIDMPKTCAECPFDIEGDCVATKNRRMLEDDTYTDEKGYTVFVRESWCPLLDINIQRLYERSEKGQNRIVEVLAVIENDKNNVS